MRVDKLQMSGRSRLAGNVHIVDARYDGVFLGMNMRSLPVPLVQHIRPAGHFKGGEHGVTIEHLVKVALHCWKNNRTLEFP